MPKTEFIPKIENHFQMLATASSGICKGNSEGMWLSVVDTRTGKHPDFEHIPRRTYRLIGAPRGSTLYWDQPSVAAAHALSEVTGDSRYRRAADKYISSFLRSCVDGNGMFQWGNHQYYDVFENRAVRFQGGYHELRPITPAWGLFWRHSPELTSTYIRAMSDRHVYDPGTGAFNRHDDGKKGHAFLEAGGILVESLAWLHGRTKDPALIDAALRIAQYSFSRRNELTGLIPNEPDFGRWDSTVCTTEVGLWAQSLLRASAYASSQALAEMAQNAVSAYLQYGYDDSEKMYYGQLRVEDGMPVVPSKEGYWPRKHADVWNTGQWPTHDYPMALAEACVALYDLTKERIFLNGIRRWAEIVARNIPVRGGEGAYAEDYGRCIHFLARAAAQLADEQMLSLAHALASEAMNRLFDNGMFQGYPDMHLHESVSGAGYLLLSLILLETGREPELHGFGF